jgi:hypothetical protein
MSRNRQSSYGGGQLTNRPPSVRPGEGASVSVVLGSATANGLQTAAINLSDAPVPERKYAADVSAVAFVPGTVQILFGQRRIGGSKPVLRSLLVIHMAPSAAARFLESTAQFIPYSLAEIARLNGISAEASPPILEEPDQTIALAAGFVLTAASGEDATLDFYQASAFAMSAVKSGSLSLDPVVRVDLRTSLLLGLVEELQKISPQLPKAPDWKTHK